jgi:hypothetical protein
MYSKAAWGGPVDPFILTVFPQKDIEGDGDPIVSLVVFEWKDESLIGIRTDLNSYEKEYICDPAAVNAGYCNETNIGEFILAPNATVASNNLILTRAVHLKQSTPINYPIQKTGYFCVGTYGYNTDEFMAVVEFREAFGELPATQIPKLPFYGGITILYAVVLV